MINTTNLSVEACQLQRIVRWQPPRVPLLVVVSTR